MKTIATVLLSLLFGTFCARGTTYNSNGSASDVQAKHNAASNGDTVTLPAGSFTWSTPVTISKAVKLRGAGSGRIIGWSQSSQTFGTGTKTFTVQSGFAVANGTTLRIWQTATDKQTLYMLGTVTSVVGTTLTMDVTKNTGSGTKTLWLMATEFSTRVIHSAGASVLLPITETTTGSPEVSGIQFTIGTGTGRLIAWSYVAGGQPILIHDCWFYLNASNIAIETSSTTRGVIWNCSVNWSFFAQSNAQFLHLPINSRTEVWSAPSTMGMADTTGKSNIYVEDCDFHGCMVAVDLDSNSKVVWRHNIMNNAGIGSHGYDTSAFGARHWEFYNNQFLFSNVGNDSLNVINHLLLRGGTGVITDNYFEDINSQAWANKPELQFGVWCLKLWGQPPGHWSGNDGGIVEYPAPRQIGFGHVTGTGRDGKRNSVSNGVYVGDSEPIYIWGNTGFTPTITITVDDNGPAVPDNPADYFRPGRDYFNNGTAKPGYAKYTYPHPLRSSTSPGQPSAPKELRAVGP